MGWTADKGNEINGMIIIVSKRKNILHNQIDCVVFIVQDQQRMAVYYLVNFYLLVKT
jgi:hypothetical protein